MATGIMRWASLRIHFPTRQRFSYPVGGDSFEVARAKLLDSGMNISALASVVLRCAMDSDMESAKVGNSQTYKMFEVVRFTPRDVGFQFNPRQDDMCQRAMDLGYKLIPAKTVSYLRRSYADQPVGERAVVGMIPVEIPSGEYTASSLFCLVHNSSGMGLCTMPGNSEVVHMLDTIFLFQQK
jgi:hypothetical protein